MKFAYFPGCSLGSFGQDYHISLKYVCEALGIDLVEVEDWVCCGGFSARVTSHLLSIALPVLNLSHTEKAGLNQLVAPCSICVSRFNAANSELEHDANLVKTIHEVFDYSYQGKVEVYHPLELFFETGAEKISERIRKKLTGLKVACYYGCLRTERLDQVQGPQAMESIIRTLGAETMDWSFKSKCCGGLATLSMPEMVLKLSHDILSEAKTAGANAVAVACPLCQVNLDARQRQIEETYHTQYGIPILYFTQLIGLAFGAYPEELGIQKLATSPREVLGSIGLM